MKFFFMLLFLLALPCLGETTIPGLLAPLGQVVEVEGEIIDGSTLQRKEWDGESLLRIDQVDGKALAKPVTMRFGWHALALDKPLVGKVRLVGYETGGYGGIPEGAFEYIPRAATSGFHFEHSFLVLKLQAN